jgi:mono/diheme cytochrome c family protein
MRWMLIVPAVAVSAALVGCSKPKDEAPPPPPPSSAGTPQIPMPGGPPGPQGPGGPASAAKGDAVAGKTVFAANCAGCHGSVGAGGRPGTPNFTDAAWQKAEPDADLLKSIHDGKDKMPAFTGRLSEKDMADVLAFLRTLSAKK